MERTAAPDPRSSPLFIRFARMLILGVLTVFLFYLKVLGAILKMGMRLIRKAPADGR
ncbi:MAG: hypothetical protein K0Q91_1631 [Fibrobacteria bacterium]|jgi:hypothetical protein|nr:hypothetical protein [Fibrobacteria bacterium]